MAEAMAIVVRYVSSAWRITQCLVRALLVTKTMSGEEVACELIATLSITLGIASGHLLAAMRDRCSVNGVAMRTLKVVYPYVLTLAAFLMRLIYQERSSKHQTWMSLGLPLYP